VLLAAVFSVAVGLPAADAAGPTRPRPGFALTLSPARLVVPTIGGRSTQQLTVTNNGDQPLPIGVAVDAFQQALDGTISFTTDGPYSATRWVRVTPPTFTIAAGRSQAVRVDVTVPPNPEPGEHQVGIVFLTAQHQARGNLAVNREVGAQLLINAPGPVTNRITLGRLRAPSFADGGPVALRLGVRNDGTAHRDYLPPRLLHGTVHGQRVDFPSFNRSTRLRPRPHHKLGHPAMGLHLPCPRRHRRRQRPPDRRNRSDHRVPGPRHRRTAPARRRHQPARPRPSPPQHPRRLGGPGPALLSCWSQPVNASVGDGSGLRDRSSIGGVGCQPAPRRDEHERCRDGSSGQAAAGDRSPLYCLQERRWSPVVLLIETVR